MRERRGVRLATLVAVALLLLGVERVAAAPSWLGVRIRDLTEQETDQISARHGINEGFGVVIVDVVEGTPAARAGLKAGDIVVAFAGRPVVETKALQHFVAQTPTDRETTITVLRSEGRQQLHVTPVAMPKLVVGERIASEFGFALRDLESPRELAGARGSSTVPSVGVVTPRSAAERAGLEVGDRILQVNDRGVLTREDASDALAEASADQPLRLLVRRGAERIAVTLPPASSAR